MTFCHDVRPFQHLSQIYMYYMDTLITANIKAQSEAVT